MSVQPTQVQLTNNGPVGSLRLKCSGVNPTWLVNDKSINYGNENLSTNLYSLTSSNQYLTNNQKVSGSYIGQYKCQINGETKTIWDVQVPGAGLSGGAIAGIVIGILVALMLLIAVILLGMKKGWFNKLTGDDDDGEGNDILDDTNARSENIRYNKPGYNSGRQV